MSLKQNITRMDVALSSENNNQTVDKRDSLSSESLEDWAALDRRAKFEPKKYYHCMERSSSNDTLRCQERRPASAPVANVAGIITSIPRNLKVRQHLQLPPFNSLGLAAPYSNFLLTPPDETEIIKWNASSRDPLQIPTSTSVPSPTNFTSKGTTPETPNVHEPVPGNVTNTPALTQSFAEGAMAEGGTGSGLDGSGRSASWIDEAVRVATSSITTTHDSRSHVLNVLCHSQPCPLSDEATSTSSAYASIITALQAKFEAAQGRYIEVTHAVPVKFTMARLPISPVTTPSMATSSADQVDYFNMTVFAKAVVAVDHHNASVASVPSSPHPVVAPASVGVSLLERFIPPTTLQEYLDLFTSDSPSVLVDRLVELSPENGTLIFIYPTASGATTFASRYLGPLLDPLLRAMIQIHELTVDICANVGKMPVVGHMVSYEQMLHKINILLRHMSRGNSRNGVHPKFALVHWSKQIVQLEREAWTEWWTHQETPRIREVMNRYFQRALKLPQSKEITAGSLVREILLGVENRAYTGYDEPREGVEVGVFVIRRTA